MKQPFNDGQLGLTLGDARIDDRACLGRGSLTLLDEERFDACPLAVDLGRALPFGRKRLVHLLSQPRRRVRCACSSSARRLSQSPKLCARGRFASSRGSTSTNAIGLRDDAAIGIGRRIGQTSLKPALPLLADGLDAFAVTLLGFGRGFHEVLDLESRPFRLGGIPSLGFGRRIGKSGLEPSLPFLADRLDFCRPDLGGFRLRLAPCGLAFFCEPIGHLSDLRLKVRLQPGTECVDGRTKIVIGHFRHYRHYRDGP